MLLFAQERGFERILERLHNVENKASPVIVKHLVRTVGKLAPYLSKTFLKPYAMQLKDAVFSLILGLSQDELKNADKKIFTDITLSMDTVLRCATSTSESNKILNTFNLDLALKVRACVRAPVKSTFDAYLLTGCSLSLALFLSLSLVLPLDQPAQARSRFERHSRSDFACKRLSA